MIEFNPMTPGSRYIFENETGFLVCVEGKDFDYLNSINCNFLIVKKIDFYNNIIYLGTRQIYIPVFADLNVPNIMEPINRDNFERASTLKIPKNLMDLQDHEFCLWALSKFLMLDKIRAKKAAHNIQFVQELGWANFHPLELINEHVYVHSMSFKFREFYSMFGKQSTRKDIICAIRKCESSFSAGIIDYVRRTVSLKIKALKDLLVFSEFKGIFINQRNEIKNTIYTMEAKHVVKNYEEN